MWRPTTASSARWAVVSCALVCASAARADSASLSWLGPARTAKVDSQRAQLNAKCTGCHAEEARQWRGSLHRQAFSDRLFQAAYTLEPLAFCRGCHAPEADPARPPTPELAELGVACTTCHVESANVVTASLASGGSPHPVRADPALTTRKACARCHEFEFPLLPGVAMQSTLSEHARSTSSARECQSCHMPLDAERHKPTHDFSVLANPAMIRSAVRVSAARWNDSSIEVTLRAGTIGHAFPTGDLFRRLELRACVEQAGHEVCAPPAHLGRQYRVHVTPQGTERVPIADTRVAAPGTAPPSTVRLPFDIDVSKLVVRWSVVYQRADDAMAKVFGLDPKADEIPVASGQL
jgi:Cytochrome c554 and c-prime